MLKESLGMLEVKGLVAAITVGDTMAKAANVHIRQKTLARGHGWTTILVTGDVGSVNAALSAGRAVATEHGWLISSKVIARPASTLECALEPDIKATDKAVEKVETTPSEVTATENVDTENKAVENKISGAETIKEPDEIKEPVQSEEVKTESSEKAEKSPETTVKKTTRSTATKAKKTKTKK